MDDLIITHQKVTKFWLSEKTKKLSSRNIILFNVILQAILYFKKHLKKIKETLNKTKFNLTSLHWKRTTVKNDLKAFCFFSKRLNEKKANEESLLFLKVTF